MSLGDEFLGKLANSLITPVGGGIADLVDEVLNTFTEDEVDALTEAIALDLTFGPDANLNPVQQAASEKFDVLVQSRHAVPLPNEDSELELWPVEEADESIEPIWFDDSNL